MIAKFRIGYPYASSNPQKTKESIVLLRPSNYPGFRSIIYGEEEYLLPPSDKGPLILNGHSQGVLGELWETQDERKSIAKTIANEKRIHGEGRSSQLAIVLASCAVYNNNISHLPLLLFSGAIHRPIGAPPFLDSTIQTYCEPSEAESCLIEKYKACKMAKAQAFVVPERDAQILTNMLEKKYYFIEKITTLKTDENSEPLIIGIKENQLPEISSLIGISSHHYKQNKKKNSLLYAFIITIVILILSVGFHYAFNKKTQEQKGDILPSQSQLVKISRTQWIGGNAYVTSPRSLPFAYMDIDKNNIRQLHWSGANCVFSFRLEAHAVISIQNISIEGTHELLPEYEVFLGQMGKFEIPYLSNATHFLYGEITQTPTPSPIPPHDIVKVFPQEQQEFILRIGASKPGIYHFSIKLLLHSEKTKEEIVLCDTKTVLFDLLNKEDK